MSNNMKSKLRCSLNLELIAQKYIGDGAPNGRRHYASIFLSEWLKRDKLVSLSIFSLPESMLFCCNKGHLYNLSNSFSAPIDGGKYETHCPFK